MDDFNKVADDLAKKQEELIFERAKEVGDIEDAVLIMHPKHKRLMIESGLKPYILWTSLCEEDKAYMVTDKVMKNNIKEIIYDKMP
jgi:hypothetical protein